MNFVIVTPGYYPHNGAESYCATRFATALAVAGHNVHVITSWRPDEMYSASYVQLTNPNVKVTRVDSRGCHKLSWPYIDWRHFIVWDDDQQAVRPYIAATRNVLAQYDSPILITRTYPWLSLYVGWHCRKFAAKWIQHFSDPMIDFKPFCKLAYLRLWSLKWWMRRAMKHADAISVTCKRVRWYYREKLGSCVDKAKFILATHIGDFKLEKSKSKVEVEERNFSSSKKDETTTIPHSSFLIPHLIYHDGDIYGGRGLLMVDAVDKLNAEGFPCIFLQGRDVKGEEDRKRVLSSPNCRIVGKSAAPELKVLAKSAQVSFVADFNTPGLSYSPFLMSKFVYQLFTDKPIVVLSKLESEKHDYCVAYPEAGLFFAEIGNVDSLVAAIKAAFACDPSSIDRSRIREAFSEEAIGKKFVEEVVMLER